MVASYTDVQPVHSTEYFMCAQDWIFDISHWTHLLWNSVQHLLHNCDRLPREVVESASLDVFRSCVHAVLRDMV